MAAFADQLQAPEPLQSYNIRPSSSHQRRSTGIFMRDIRPVPSILLQKRGSGFIPLTARKPHVSLFSPLTSVDRKESVYDIEGPCVVPQDLEKSRLLKGLVRDEYMKGVVSRSTRPTEASIRRAAKNGARDAIPSMTLDPYKWGRLAAHTNYQRQLYTSLGSVQPGFKRTVQAVYPALSRGRVPLGLT